MQAMKRRRRAPPSPGMRSCAKCGRIYPARALVVANAGAPTSKEVLLCGADALKIAVGIEGMRLSRLKVVARKARLYDRRMCR